MSPDVSRNRARGIIALVTAVLIASGACWWVSDQSAEQSIKLATARASAANITGPMLLAKLVEQVRAENVNIRRNISELKRGMGMTIEEGAMSGEGTVTSGYTVPKGYPDRAGEFFRRRFLAVRDDFVRKNEDTPWPIVYAADLGFLTNAQGIPPDHEAPALLGRLQLTNKVLMAFLSSDRQDRIANFTISNGEPTLSGPINRPPLLREYPIKLQVDGGLPTIMQLLYAFSDRSAGKFPLILRNLTITCDKNRKPARDNVQQVNAKFDLAAMEFIPDGERDGQSGAAVRSGGAGSDAWKSQP